MAAKIIAFHSDGIERERTSDLLQQSFDGLGHSLVAITCVQTPADIAFMKACVEKRVPIIALIEREIPEEAVLFLTVAWAKFPIDPELDDSVQKLLEWADFLLLDSEEKALKKDAQALGIPHRDLSAGGEWIIPPDPARAPRHGFQKRSELLTFLEIRFGNNSN